MAKNKRQRRVWDEMNENRTEYVNRYVVCMYNVCIYYVYYATNVFLTQSKCDFRAKVLRET